MKVALFGLALSAVDAPSAVRACTLSVPPVATTADEIGAKGVLIKGKLIQAFDPDKETVEIIEAQEVYVGSDRPKTYVIYRPKSEFALARERRRPSKKGVVFINCAPSDHKIQLGMVLDRLALMPAPVADDSPDKGSWVFHFWNGNVSRGPGLDLLLKSAEQHGRLLSRPRRDGAENCGECGSPSP